MCVCVCVCVCVYHVQTGVMDSDDEDSVYVESSYCYEDLTFLEACLEADLDAIQAIVEENPTEEEINERDRSGRVSRPQLSTGGLVQRSSSEV